jgi:hypothetical protein
VVTSSSLHAYGRDGKRHRVARNRIGARTARLIGWLIVHGKATPMGPDHRAAGGTQRRRFRTEREGTSC